MVQILKIWLFNSRICSDLAVFYKKISFFNGTMHPLKTCWKSDNQIRQKRSIALITAKSKATYQKRKKACPIWEPVPLCILCCLMWPCKVGFIVKVALSMSLQVPVDNGSFKSPHPALHTAGKNPGPPPCIPRPTQTVLFGSKSGSELFEARFICRLDRTFLIYLRPRKQHRIYELYCLRTAHAFRLCVQL